MTNDVSAVLALVQGAEAEESEAEAPVPPNGSSLRAQAAWYQTLAQVDLETAAEWRLLESIADTISQYDLVHDRWVAEGSPVISTGSMGQEVEAPALGTMQKLRTQEAALWKALALPTEADQNKRRPGRPSRANGGGDARGWGSR